MTDLSALIRECGRRGLKVSNLFQLEAGGWRANVRAGENRDFADASKVSIDDLVAADFLA